MTMKVVCQLFKSQHGTECGGSCQACAFCMPRSLYVQQTPCLLPFSVSPVLVGLPVAVHSLWGCSSVESACVYRRQLEKFMACAALGVVCRAWTQCWQCAA